MPPVGYSVISVKDEIVPLLSQFQVLATVHLNRVVTKSEALKLALQLATKRIGE